MTRTDAATRALTLALLLAGIAALFGPPPWWWMGAGFVAAAIGLAIGSETFHASWARLRGALERRRTIGRFSFRLSTVLGELACIGVVIAIVAVELGKATLGDRPIDGDHPVHYFCVFNLEHNLLRHGQLRGWTHLWYAGDPAGYLYPFGAHLFVVAVHALSLGILGLSNAYGLAIFSFWALYGISVYRLGTVTSGRMVGLAAAVLALTDPGGARAGGWQQAVYVGVWPQTLAVAFAVLALSLLPSLIARQSWKPVAGFALLAGAAIVTHPLVLFLFALAPVLALSIECGRLRRASPLVALRLAAALGAGVLIGAVYWIPFAALKDWSIPTGVGWLTADEFGAKLAALDGVVGMPRAVLALGLLGTLAALTTRRTMLRLGAMLVVVMFGFAASTLPNDFHLHALLKGLYSVQYERYLILAKPFFFVLAAHAAFALFGALRRAPAPLPRGPHARLLGALGLSAMSFFAVTALAPLAVPFARNASGALVHLERASLRPRSRDDMVRWLNRNLPRDRFYRLAVDMRTHSAIDLGAELDFPLYKFGGGPVALYKFRMLGHGEPLLQMLNVRYLLTDHGVASSDFVPVQHFGPYAVYEYRKYRPDPFVVDGSGSVRVTRFDTDVIELDAAPGASGRLRLGVSYFPRWHATVDGASVPIRADALGTEPFTGFMSVPLRPGHYRFEFRQNLLDHLATIASAVGLLLALGFALLDRRAARAVRLRRTLTRAAHWLARKPRRAAPAVAAVALALLVLAAPALAVYSPPLHVGSEALHSGRVRYDFGDRLSSATVASAGMPCSWSFDGFRCGETDDVVTFGIEAVDPYIVRQCIRARTSTGGLSLEYPRVPAGDALVGYVGLSVTSADSSGSIRISLDDRVVYENSSLRRGDVTRFRAPLPASAGAVRFDIDGGARDMVCFQAQVVRN